jgi:hypothetical protein
MKTQYSYITVDGAYDVAAIMKEAHRIARRDRDLDRVEVARDVRAGRISREMPYSFWFKQALRMVWNSATQFRFAFHLNEKRDPACIAFANEQVRTYNEMRSAR